MPIPGSLPSAGTPVSTGDGLTVTPAAGLSSVLVKVDLSARLSGVVTVTVTRTANGVTVPVRGMDTVVAPNGILTGIDHELPLGVTCTYRAATSTVATSSAATSLPALADRCWLKSLSDPTLSGYLTVFQYPDWSQAKPQSVLTVIGRPDPIVVSGTRGLATGTLQMLTSTAADVTGALALLAADGGPYLLQFPASSGEPDVYVAVGDLGVTRPIRIGSNPDRVLQLPLTIVARPATAGSSVVVPGHRCADLVGTWAAQTGRYVDL